MFLLTFRPVEALIVDYFRHLVSSSPPPDTTPLPDNLLELTLGQLGGDSLTAMRLSALINEHLHVEITAEVILRCCLGKVLELVSGDEVVAKRASEPIPRASKAVDGAKAISWEDEASLDDLGLEALCHKQRRPGRDDAVEEFSVLLTGATGFLGRFILLELLQNQQCGRIHCIVREREGVYDGFHGYIHIMDKT